jgi:signal peptidase II
MTRLVKSSLCGSAREDKMQKLKRLILLLVVLFTSVGCDQATKSVAQTHLSSAEPITLLNGMVRLKYAENPGAFLSLGAGLSETAQYWIFVVMVSVILLALFFYIIKNLQKMPPMMLVALSLFLGGGVGNLIDRLVNDGRVIDFMNVGIGNLRTGVFNVADMALMAGLGIIIIISLRPSEDEPEGTEKRSLNTDFTD